MSKSKNRNRDKPAPMSLREIALQVLAGADRPLSAKEVWIEAYRQELVGRSSSTALRPETTLGAFLYKAARKGIAGVVGTGEYPVRFHIEK